MRIRWRSKQIDPRGNVIEGRLKLNFPWTNYESLNSNWGIAMPQFENALMDKIYPINPSNHIVWRKSIVIFINTCWNRAGRASPWSWIRTSNARVKLSWNREHKCICANLLLKMYLCKFIFENVFVQIYLWKCICKNVFEQIYFWKCICKNVFVPMFGRICICKKCICENAVEMAIYYQK